MDYQEDKKNLDAEKIDQLNLDTDEMTWASGTPARDPRTAGNKAISTPEPQASANTPFASESQPIPDQFYPESDTEEPELGSIINLEMPPNATPEQPQLDLGSSQPSSLNIAPIKATDQLSKEDVKTIDVAVEKLGQDGNIADFYDAIRNVEEGPEESV